MGDDSAATAAALSSSYRQFAELGSVASAWLHPEDASGKVFRATLRRNVRDVAAGRMRSTLQTLFIDIASGRVAAAAPAPCDPCVVSYTLSPSGRFACAIKKEAPAAASGSGGVSGADAAGKSRTVIEIWDIATGSLHRMVCPDAALHGDPIADSFWGDAVWNADETLVAYIAEAAAPSSSLASFFDPPKAEQQGKAAYVGPGHQFDFVAAGKESWGEKYDAVRLPRLFIVDIPGCKVTAVSGISDDVAAGQPAWAPRALGADSSLLTYTGWSCLPRRLGIIYCFQRPCGIYAVDTGPLLRRGSSTAPEADAPPPAPHLLLTPGDTVARCGRFTPGPAPLMLYLSAEGAALQTHGGAVVLKALEWTEWGGAATVAQQPGAGAEATAPVSLVLLPSVEVPSLNGPGGAVAGVVPPYVQPYVCDLRPGPPGALAAGAAASPASPAGSAPPAAASSSPTPTSLLTPFPGLYTMGPPCGAPCFSPDGGALYLTALLGHRSTVLKVDLAAALAGAREGTVAVTCVSEEAGAVALLPAQSWGGGAAGGPSSSPSAAVAAAVDAGLWGTEGSPGEHRLPSSSLLALAPLEGHGGKGGAVALLVSVSCPSHPERLALLLAGMSSSSWLLGTERKPTVVLPLPAPPSPAWATAEGSVPRGSATTGIGMVGAPQTGGGPGRSLHGISWRALRVRPTTGDTAVLFTSLLLHPNLGQSGSPLPACPLVVVPHGGPHSAFCSDFLPPYAWLCAALGVSVLLVNYRGSTGCGEASLASLPGRIGSQDVSDVAAATLTALRLGGVAEAELPRPGPLGSADGSTSPPVVGAGPGAVPPSPVDLMGQAPLAGGALRLDPFNVVVVGGSHGGFLAGHLIGLHPELFKAAAMRNPVTNIASMVSITDIPDWCWIEALGLGAYTPFNAHTPAGPSPCGFPAPHAEALAAMAACSPVQHVAEGRVKAATLLLLGLRDRRVPAANGLEFYHALRGAGLRTRLLCYPEDTHAIDKPGSEADAWMNIALFIAQECGR